MANITQRTNKKGEISYLIRVFVDEKSDGKQKVKSMTFKPDPDLKKKEQKKMLQEKVLEFEKQVRNRSSDYDGRTKFEIYANHWMENAQIAPATRSGYEIYLRRINDAIGHKRLEDIQARHLKDFYKNLAESGVKNKGQYALSKGLVDLIRLKGITRGGIAKIAGIAPSTVSTACKGKRISIECAEKIAVALDLPVRQVFNVHESTAGLSDKTIRHHHRLISAILGTARMERIISFNVAREHMKAPDVNSKEAKYLDDIQAQKLVSLLLNEEDIRVKTSILLALYSGVRRGELCGLSWDDIDERRGIIHVLRASQYQKGKGVVETTTKNESSKRAIKLPPIVFEILFQYRKWWREQRILNGDRWQGEANRLFIQGNGLPISPDTINFWLNKFIKKHDLEHFTPHSLRHTFSTLQIMAGVDVRTLQARTGHSQASTLTNIYAHSIKSAQAAATDALDNILTQKAQSAR